MSFKPLSGYARRTYSQNGEEGIITEILRRISKDFTLDRWCVEFGAWDGVYLSNTCKFIREDGYKAVLIEGNPEKISELEKNFPSNEIEIICKYVDFEGVNSLDTILSETRIPSDFDFISIDVDGVDYHIFDSLKKYSPKIVCIEFNPSIPNMVDYVQPRDFRVNHGSSAKALNRLAESKGYKLVSVLGYNLFFVKREFLNSVLEASESLELLNPQGNDPLVLFVGYDGTILSNKSGFQMPWHSIFVPIARLQVLPKCLRVFSGDYGIIKRLLFMLYLFITRPAQMFSKAKDKIAKH
jgi:hypothetical protein